MQAINIPQNEATLWYMSAYGTWRVVRRGSSLRLTRQSVVTQLSRMFDLRSEFTPAYTITIEG